MSRAYDPKVDTFLANGSFPRATNEERFVNSLLTDLGSVALSLIPRSIVRLLAEQVITPTRQVPLWRRLNIGAQALGWLDDGSEIAYALNGKTLLLNINPKKETPDKETLDNAPPYKETLDSAPPSLRNFFPKGQENKWPSILITTKDARADPAYMVHHMLYLLRMFGDIIKNPVDVITKPEQCEAGKKQAVVLGVYNTEGNIIDNTVRTLLRVACNKRQAREGKGFSNALMSPASKIMGDQILATISEKKDGKVVIREDASKIMSRVMMYGFGEGSNIVSDAARYVAYQLTKVHGMGQKKVGQILKPSFIIGMCGIEEPYSRAEQLLMPDRHVVFSNSISNISGRNEHNQFSEESNPGHAVNAGLGFFGRSNADYEQALTGKPLEELRRSFRLHTLAATSQVVQTSDI